MESHKHQFEEMSPFEWFDKRHTDLSQKISKNDYNKFNTNGKLNLPPVVPKNRANSANREVKKTLSNNNSLSNASTNSSQGNRATRAQQPVNRGASQGRIATNN